MNPKKIVVALGGNALGNNSTEQKAAVKKVATVILDLHEQGNQIVICHGNGPQVGTINQAFQNAHQQDENTELMPFAECGAMSQGYIGFHLQNALQNEIKTRNTSVGTVSLVTQTLVNKDDPAFQNPSKPVGSFLSENEAQQLALRNGWIIKEDAGRGWRRVVPSPLPQKIIELSQIKNLLKHNTIVIAAGGGGVPVYLNQNDEYVSVDAVIDKDHTSAQLAIDLAADSFFILTAVDNIKLNYGKATEESLKKVSTAQLTKHISDQQFAPGSMLPKVKAAMLFTNTTSNSSYIADLQFAKDVFNRKHGTEVYKEETK